MYVTPESGPNLMYWNFWPMGVTNYGGDLQIFNLPEYTAAPLQFNLNPIGLEYVRTSAFQGIGGGWSSAQVDVNAVNALTQQFVAPVLQQNAAQHYTQAGQGVTALKTSLNSLLINPNATTEDREKANEYLAKIDKLEAELKALEGQELSAKEVYDKSSAIEKELRQIATSVGELNTKISKAATEAAQVASNSQSQVQSAQESEGVNESTNSNQSTVSADLNCELKPGLFKGRLAGQEATVVRICKKYGVSPALVASIIGLESGWGTSNLAMHNNFGGYRAAGDLGKNAKGFGYFSTIEKGLEAMIKNLAAYDERYSDVKAVDFANIDAIAKHYCSPVWADNVERMYNSRVKKYLA